MVRYSTSDPLPWRWLLALFAMVQLSACTSPKTPLLVDTSGSPGPAGSASAAAAQLDEVAVLLTQLRSHAVAAQRQAAAQQLADRGAKRAIPSLIEALADADGGVRAASCSALGVLVDSSVEPALRDRAQAALGRLAQDDADQQVRSSAAAAHAKLENISGGIYVALGDMAATPSGEDALKAHMGTVIAKVIAAKAPTMKTAWPGGPPSSEQLKAHRAVGYFVNGTLAKVSAEAAGKSTAVSCGVSILIATYPDKNILGFADGQARVQSGSSPKSIKFGKEACVSALVESLVARKVIKTLQSHAANKP